MFDALTGLMDMKNPPMVVGKLSFQINDAYGFHDPKETNGISTYRCSLATMGLDLLTLLHCIVNYTFRSKAPGLAA
ncbi:unnamed protein product [Schistosoma margrebowiei]|uniref:Uncharacterized protein n=1 Tax=Schistosoma margrebowiei TaxID=48269 RepID=A0A183N2Q2_9TREM|nr:unnamed protein product [Schistosoma margrebowiei]